MEAAAHETQLIEQQQQRVTQYRQHLDQQQGLAQQQTARLQQQNRMAQYRFQEQYSERLRQQRIGLQNDRDHDYNEGATSEKSLRAKAFSVLILKVRGAFRLRKPVCSPGWKTAPD
jgi:hypothetical protein